MREKRKRDSGRSSQLTRRKECGLSQGGFKFGSACEKRIGDLSWDAEDPFSTTSENGKLLDWRLLRSDVLNLGRRRADYGRRKFGGPMVW